MCCGFWGTCCKCSHLIKSLFLHAFNYRGKGPLHWAHCVSVALPGICRISGNSSIISLCPVTLEAGEKPFHESISRWKWWCKLRKMYWSACVWCFSPHICHHLNKIIFIFQAVENGADTSAFISPDVANFPVKRENGKLSNYHGKKAFPPKCRELTLVYVIAQTADFETLCPPWKQVPQANYKS